VLDASLLGPDYFPGRASIDFDTSGALGPLHIERAGTGPVDDFTCYEEFTDARTCRWGDYSGSVAVGPSTIISGGSAITGDRRTQFTNWSTYIARQPA
jgi:hypothetical protein